MPISNISHSLSLNGLNAAIVKNITNIKGKAEKYNKTLEPVIRPMLKINVFGCWVLYSFIILYKSHISILFINSAALMLFQAGNNVVNKIYARAVVKAGLGYNLTSLSA